MKEPLLKKREELEKELRDVMVEEGFRKINPNKRNDFKVYSNKQLNQYYWLTTGELKGCSDVVGAIKRIKESWEFFKEGTIPMYEFEEVLKKELFGDVE